MLNRDELTKDIVLAMIQGPGREGLSTPSNMVESSIILADELIAQLARSDAEKHGGEVFELGKPADLEAAEDARRRWAAEHDEPPDPVGPGVSMV